MKLSLIELEAKARANSFRGLTVGARTLVELFDRLHELAQQPPTQHASESSKAAYVAYANAVVTSNDEETFVAGWNAALAQQAQPLTDVDLRQIIQCIDDGEPIDPDDTRKLAQMLRDRMAQR